MTAEICPQKPDTIGSWVTFFRCRRGYFSLGFTFQKLLESVHYFLMELFNKYFLKCICTKIMLLDSGPSVPNNITKLQKSNSYFCVLSTSQKVSFHQYSCQVKLEYSANFSFWLLTVVSAKMLTKRITSFMYFIRHDNSQTFTL